MRISPVFFALSLVFVSGAVYAQGDDAAPADDAAASADAAAPADAAAAPADAAAAPADDAAATKASGGSGKAAYGSSGCGLGTMIITPSNGFSQVWAATTNGTSASQTFGITSGTSGCDGTGYQPGSTTAFVQTNRTAVAKDAARGNGATIAALSDIAGCKDSNAVGKKLQKDFSKIFTGASVSDKQVSESIVKILKSDKSLSCSHVS